MKVALADGRTLFLFDEGDPDGFPVVVHSGTPGSGLLFRSWIEDARTRGIRLIGYDRAGYGESTAKPGRTVADVAPDVEQALDALGLERFATWGVSGGGPHALACGALLPARCVAVATLASPAPFEAEGLDWLAGQGEGNIIEMAAAQAGAAALEPVLREVGREMLAATPEQLRDAIASLLSKVDQEALTGELAVYLLEATRRGIGERVDGWRDDDLAFLKPWGFDLARIEVPVQLWQGVHDLMVPPAHGVWLGEHVSGADIHVSDADGHLTLTTSRLPDIHAWLLSHA